MALSSEPEASTTAVRAYQLLPLDVADAVGRVLPALEIAVGLLLVLGLLSRWAAVVSALLLAAFVVGIVSVWVRGIPIGQNAGQRVLRALHEDVARGVERIGSMADHEAGATSPGLEIAQMRHAWQRARMFMS